jgi:DNA polymerase-3 subunit delta'
MYLKPSENIQLFGMNIFFNEIANLYNQKKMPNKILLSGKKGLGKSTLAYHIINYILSLDEDYKYDINKFTIHNENKSYKLLQNHSHPNFYLVDLLDDKKNIDVAQVREMIKYTNKSSFNDMPRFILIDNIENLNKNSVNALLKIIEEPNHGVFFILINNNEKKILPTLRSRCLTFKINLTFKNTTSIINQLLKKNIFEICNNDLIHYYITPGEIINLVNIADEKKINLLEHNLKSLLNLLIDGAYYKKNKLVKSVIINFIELIFLKEYRFGGQKSSLISFYHYFMDKINNTEKFNLDDESLFLEFKSKLLNG